MPSGIKAAPGGQKSCKCGRKKVGETERAEGRGLEKRGQMDGPTDGLIVDMGN